jgi:hypothetical protein
MDVAKMITDLRQEREHVEDAIMALQRLAQGQAKRRGRPPDLDESSAGRPKEAWPSTAQQEQIENPRYLSDRTF